MVMQLWRNMRVTSLIVVILSMCGVRLIAGRTITYECSACRAIYKVEVMEQPKETAVDKHARIMDLVEHINCCGDCSGKDSKDTKELRRERAALYVQLLELLSSPEMQTVQDYPAVMIRSENVRACTGSTGAACPACAQNLCWTGSVALPSDSGCSNPYASSGVLHIQSPTWINGPLAVLNGTYSTAITTSALRVYGSACLDGAVCTGGGANFGGTLCVTDSAFFGKDVIVTGSLMVQHTSVINNDFTITGNLAVGGALSVTGNTALGTASAGALTASSAAITSNATVGGTLGVTGSSTFGGTVSTGALTASSETITGNVSIGGTLGVTGNTTLSGVSTGVLSANSIAVTNNVTIGGNLNVDGTINGTIVSSQELKTDVATLAFDDAMSTLQQLHPVTYRWINPDLHNGNTGAVAGFIAQEVAEVLPSLVRDTVVSGADSALLQDGIAAKGIILNDAFVAYLIAGVVGLYQQAQTLQQQVTALQQSLA